MEMRNDRLSKLKSLIADDPSDLFLQYALAMEYLGMKETELARKQFESIIATDENYVPVYYQLGLIFQQMNEDQQAIATLEKGLEKALVKKDQKTIREFQALLDDLKY